MLLYERIYNHVLERIRDGALAPGDRVPSEMELAEQFDVSRITSKKALELLRQRGLIERVRGKGSFVSQTLPVETAPAVPPRHATALGLIIPDLSEVYGLELLYAIEERCADLDLHLVIRRTRGHQEHEERAIASLVDSGLVDGLIIFPVHGEYYNATLVRIILDAYPLVLVDRHLSGIPASAVATDNVAASAALTGHLLDLGHTDIAFVSPPPENTSSIEARLEGFRTAFAVRGLAHQPRHLLTDLRCTLPGAFTAAEVDKDVERIAAFVAREPSVSAFVASEYNLARVLRRATDKPVACFDSPADPVDGPVFPHIRQDQRAMGTRSVDLLLAQLAGEAVPKQTTVPFSLVIPD